MIGRAGVAVPAPHRVRPAHDARRYRLVDLRSGEDIEVEADDLLRVVGVELSLVDWAIAIDGAFENGCWRVEAGLLG